MRTDEAIRYYIKKAGFETNQQFCDYCNIPKSSFYNWMRNPVSINIYNFHYMAQHLNCSMDELYGGPKDE